MKLEYNPMEIANILLNDAFERDYACDPHRLQAQVYLVASSMRQLPASVWSTSRSSRTSTPAFCPPSTSCSSPTWVTRSSGSPRTLLDAHT